MSTRILRVCPSDVVRTNVLKHKSRPWTAAIMLACVVLGALPAAACSARVNDTTVASQLPGDCTAFVSAYKTCLSRSIPALPDVVEERANQTRTALEHEAAAGATAEALASKCRGNLETLTTSCASPTR